MRRHECRQPRDRQNITVHFDCHATNPADNIEKPEIRAPDDLGFAEDELLALALGPAKFPDDSEEFPYILMLSKEKYLAQESKADFTDADNIIYERLNELPEATGDPPGTLADRPPPPPPVLPPARVGKGAFTIRHAKQNPRLKKHEQLFFMNAEPIIFGSLTFNVFEKRKTCISQAIVRRKNVIFRQYNK